MRGVIALLIIFLFFITPVFADEYEKVYQNYDDRLFDLFYEKPTKFRVFMTDLFFEPNYNITEGYESFDKSKIFLEESKEASEHDSQDLAITKLNKAGANLVKAETIISRELELDREFDNRWFLNPFLPLIVFIFFWIIRSIVLSNRY